MDAFLLETLQLNGWRRGGEIFWRQRDAIVVARNLVRQKRARAVRILPLQLSLTPVAEIPTKPKEFANGNDLPSGAAP